MATRLYLTSNSAPAGAPTESIYTPSSGDTFAGDYTYPAQALEGISTRVPSSLQSFRLTANAGLIGTRNVIEVAHPSVEIQLISGQAVATYYTHYHYTAAAIFSAILTGGATISGNNLLSGGFTQNVKVSSWTGAFSYYDDSRGVGGIGILPRIYYVWRPSTQSVVGVLAEASEALHSWTTAYDWSAKANSYYMDGARRFPNWQASYTWSGTPHYYDVTDVESGDLLCVEYWTGRRFINGTWGFLPWDPPQFDGDTSMATTYGIPVGGDADQDLYQTAAGGTYRNFIESTQTFSVREVPGPRPTQCSVGF